jgi:hypothetical protein
MNSSGFPTLFPFPPPAPPFAKPARHPTSNTPVATWDQGAVTRHVMGRCMLYLI